MFMCVHRNLFIYMHAYTHARAHTHTFNHSQRYSMQYCDVHRVKMLRALLNFENFGKVLRIVALDSKYAKALTFENGCQPCYAKPK